MDNSDKLQVGSLVDHDSFGYGVVLRLEGDCDCRRLAHVQFRSGVKRILLRYAPLTDLGWICARPYLLPAAPAGVDQQLWARYLLGTEDGAS